MLEKNKELMQKNPFAWENYEYDMDSNVYYDQNHQSYSEDHIKKMQDAYERQQYEEQNKNKIQNPYAQENFEYNMDDDLYYSEKGDVYTPDQLEKLQKEYEESLQKQEENKNDELYGDNLDITIHETRSEEEMARLYANENQLKLKESIDEEITEVNIKQDSVQAPEGDPIPEPQYIGWDRAFTVRQKDDSEKMADIRACLERYHKVKGSMYEGDALRDLITSCNTYTWMKIPFLKFGKAKTRLNEVKALRTRAMQELEDSAYKNVSMRDAQEAEEVPQEGVAEEKLIYNEQDTYEDKLEASASKGKRFLGRVAEVFGSLVLTPLKIVTYPLKLAAYGVDKLYRHVEKKFDVKDTRREIDLSVYNWNPSHYYYQTLNALNEPLFTISTEKKQKLLDEKDDASLYQTSTEEKELEEYEDAAHDLWLLKDELRKEYQKKTPDEARIRELNEEIESEKEKIRDNYPDTENLLADHKSIDEELRHFRRNSENLIIKQSRKPATAEQLAAEKKLAEAQATEVRYLYDNTREILNLAGYSSNDEYRKLCGYTGPMAVFCEDTREKTLERAKALSVPPEQATEEQKQAMAKELESAFKVIMEFDLKKLNFKSYSDLLDESYREVILMTKFCFEFNSLFDYYDKLLETDTPNLLFTKEEYLEIKAKKDFLLTAESVYEGVPGLMMTDTCEKLDGLQILGFSDKEVADMTKKENIREIRQKHPEINKNDVEMLRNNASVAKEGIHTYGFLPGMDIEEMYQAKKTRLLGSPGGDAEQRIKEKLSA